MSPFEKAALMACKMAEQLRPRAEAYTVKRIFSLVHPRREVAMEVRFTLGGNTLSRVWSVEFLLGPTLHVDDTVTVLLPGVQAYWHRETDEEDRSWARSLHGA